MNTFVGISPRGSSPPQKRQLPWGQWGQEHRTCCASSRVRPYRFRDRIPESVCFRGSKWKHVLFRHLNFKQVKRTLQSVSWPKTLIGFQNRYANRTIIQIYVSCWLLEKYIRIIPIPHLVKFLCTSILSYNQTFFFYCLFLTSGFKWLLMKMSISLWIRSAISPFLKVFDQV